MAKQKDIDTTPWEPYARAGARIVRVRTRELFSHAASVLDTEDIERVHDMRVASRRLRAVLEIFAACFPKAEYRSVLRDVKRLADALGERRDPDVHIAAMQAFAADLAAVNRPGIERLTEDLRGRQARGNESLAAELERLRERDLHGRLIALCDAADASLPADSAEEPLAGGAADAEVTVAADDVADVAADGSQVPGGAADAAVAVAAADLAGAPSENGADGRGAA